MTLRTEEVFTPNGFPKHTYVTRNNSELESRLALVLSMVGFVSVAGPSKSGKTVLIEKVIGPDKLITVEGGKVNSTDGVWASVISQLGESQTMARSNNSSQGEKFKMGMKAGVGVEFSGSIDLDNARGSSETKTFIHAGPEYACNILRERGLTLLVDDFHYLPKATQVELAKQFKEISRTTAKQQRVQVIVASVPHRADDAVRANPEVSGRIGTVDLEYWNAEDLVGIAEMGFSALNVQLPSILLQKMAVQAAGSPQLMQTLCFTLAMLVLKIKVAPIATQKFSPTDSEIESVLKFAATTNDSRTLIKKLEDGKPTRGVDRNIYQFADGSQGDVYKCILRALAHDPPLLDFERLELEMRVQKVCKGRPPSWPSVSQTLGHMQDLAKEMSSNAFVWDEEQLQLADPHLLFYLRWCGEYRAPRMRIFEAPPIRRKKT